MNDLRFYLKGNKEFLNNLQERTQLTISKVMLYDGWKTNWDQVKISKQEAIAVNQTGDGGVWVEREKEARKTLVFNSVLQEVFPRVVEALGTGELEG